MSDHATTTDDQVQSIDSKPISCEDCEQDVKLAFTGDGEGVNICCDCYQMDTIPYYFKVEDLPNQWTLIAETSSQSEESKQ